MSAIRNFFLKKKQDLKFKAAGPGHRLTDSSSRPASGSHQTRPQASQQTRRPPGDAQQRAAEAALARIQQQQSDQKISNRSLAAIRAQAQRELELENRMGESSRSSSVGPKEVFHESAPVLAVNGVYYHCPIVGPDVLPRPQIEAKIREFLYDNLESERGLTSCLIIHTCNKNKEKVKMGVETLQKYLTNILENPTEEKYRKIRVNNKAFQERVACLEGTFDFLMAAGFEQRRIVNGDVEEDFLVYPEERLGELENLHLLIDALMSAEPIVPVLDRGLRVLMPSQAAARIELPDDFFALTAEELAQEQARKSREVELSTELRTKAMRKRDEIRELRRYRYTLIRIRFPDGIILQGTFSVGEKLSAVREFVCENLNEPGSIFELRSPTGEVLTEDRSSLMELQLIPAVLLNISFEEGSDDAYLKPETLALLQNI